MSSLGVDLIELLAEIENATLSPEQALDRIFARLAAAMSGLMVFLWFVMLHIPRAIAAPAENLDVFLNWRGQALYISD